MSTHTQHPFEQNTDRTLLWAFLALFAIASTTYIANYIHSANAVNMSKTYHLTADDEPLVIDTN